jgi:hypothetical protein
MLTIDVATTKNMCNDGFVELVVETFVDRLPIPIFLLR